MRQKLSRPRRKAQRTPCEVFNLIYPCFEVKSLTEPEARRLQELEEARGVLLRVHEAEGQCIAVFAWGAVSLPRELREQLMTLAGKRTAILRIDGRFYVREVG